MRTKFWPLCCTQPPQITISWFTWLPGPLGIGDVAVGVRVETVADRNADRDRVAAGDGRGDVAGRVG